MINSLMQIEDGEVFDAFDRYGFIYKSSDRRFSPPEKKRDVTSYAEEDGEHVDPRTVYDVFDYNVEFVIDTTNEDLVNVNSKIAAWNRDVRVTNDYNSIRRCKTITFYDYYKRCKIVGTPEIIESVDEDKYHRRYRGLDCVVIGLKIHVSEPSKCDFNLSIGGIGNMIVEYNFIIE